MALRRGVLTAFLDRPIAVGVLLILVGVRFAAATVSAFAGIEGMDTRGLDAAFEIFADALTVLLGIVVGLSLSDWQPSVLRSRGFVAFLGLSLAAVILWAGVVNPALRILVGTAAAWSDFLLGVAAALALAALTAVLVGRLASGAVSAAALAGYRALGFGFAAALALRSLRLLDVTYLFGWTLPPGVLWALDFGPSLILAAIAIAAWVKWAWAPAGRPSVPALVIPVATAAMALAAAAGVLGGFVVSNALAWGGSYTVFAPTTVSLPAIGFAIGAFAATTWILRARLPRPARWLIFGGAAIMALAGIQTSAGTLASFAGLVAGAVVAARGVARTVAGPT